MNEQVVYAIKVASVSSSGLEIMHVKIGITKNLDATVRGYKRSNPDGDLLSLWKANPNLNPSSCEQGVHRLADKYAFKRESEKFIFLQDSYKKFAENVNLLLKQTTAESFKPKESKVEHEPAPTDNNVRASNTRLKVILPNGQVINEYKAIDTYIKTIQEFGINKVRRLQVRKGAPLISDKEYNVGVKKKYKQVPNSSLFIDVNNSTKLKKDYLEKIARLLSKEITVQIEDRK